MIAWSGMLPFVGIRAGTTRTTDGALPRVTVLDAWPPAADVVRQLGGSATRAEILRHATEHQLRSAVASGALLRVGRGRYVTHALPDPLVTAVRSHGVLSHESAAQRYGLELVFQPRAVHVTAPRGATPEPQPGVVLHRSALAPQDVTGSSTSRVRTVLDCAATLPFREALAVADSFLRTYPDQAEDLRRAGEARRGPRRQRILAVVGAADARAENAFESALRGTLVAAGLTSFTPQVVVVTAGGRYRVDLADEQRRIAVEADSFAWHGDRQALEADCRRYDELVAAGWLVLRFAWEHVMFEDEWVAQKTAEVVALRRSSRIA